MEDKGLIWSACRIHSMSGETSTSGCDACKLVMQDSRPAALNSCVLQALLPLLDFVQLPDTGSDEGIRCTHWLLPASVA